MFDLNEMKRRRQSDIGYGQHGGIPELSRRRDEVRPPNRSLIGLPGPKEGL